MTPRGYFDGVLLAVLVVAARRRNRHRTPVRSIRNRRFRAERQEAQRARLPRRGRARARARQSRAGRSRVRARDVKHARADAAGDSERVSFCLGRRARRAPPARRALPTANAASKASNADCASASSPVSAHSCTRATASANARSASQLSTWSASTSLATTRTDVVATGTEAPGIFRHTPEPRGAARGPQSPTSTFASWATNASSKSPSGNKSYALSVTRASSIGRWLAETDLKPRHPVVAVSDPAARARSRAALRRDTPPDAPGASKKSRTRSPRIEQARRWGRAGTVVSSTADPHSTTQNTSPKPTGALRTPSTR